MKTKTIICNCGRTVRCRPNGNGVVLCPRCKAAYTVGQFSARGAARDCPQFHGEKMKHNFMGNWFSGRFYSVDALRANLKTAEASRIWQLQLVLHWMGLWPHERG